MAVGKYTHVWQKYRPVILNLMVNATESPKEYKLSGHEFQDLNNKTATGYSFTMQMHKGKRVNISKRSSAMATDLMDVLKGSGKALELSEDSVFEFELDNKFNLKIKKLVQEAEV